MSSSDSAFSQFKKWVRRGVLDPLEQRRSRALLSEFTHAFRSGLVTDAESIQKLRRGWGNEAYSADADYIGEVLSRAKTCDGPILECGSGVTTLVAALACEKSGLSVWSLEQDEGWAATVEERLRALEIKNAKILYAPLKNYGNYVWYDVSRLQLPTRFALALCDGPAVFSNWGDAYLRWRYGLLPVLNSKGVSLGEILLDDADEPRAAELIGNWCKEYSLQHSMVESANGACALFRSVGKPNGNV